MVRKTTPSAVAAVTCHEGDLRSTRSVFGRPNWHHAAALDTRTLNVTENPSRFPEPPTATSIAEETSQGSCPFFGRAANSSHGV